MATTTPLQIEINPQNRLTKRLAVKEKISLANLDAVDIKILNLLKEDCRISNRKIARTLHLSAALAAARIKNLEDKGLIKGYTAVLDSLKLGYDITAVIMVRTNGAHVEDLESFLARVDNIIALYEVTGDFDVIAIAKLKDRVSLNLLINDLLVNPYVKRTVTNIAFNMVKEDFSAVF
ncbi:MAG: Lrp/AsnC family transcriptional regulator [Candidatus Bathyarchaeota archaeon]|nr:Lrp/AsnC family transcriptional regulator [Candidatus Bathyarchaeota archaeon]